MTRHVHAVAHHATSTNLCAASAWRGALPVARRLSLVPLTLVLGVQLACVSGGMHQLASDESIDDMKHIMGELDLDREIGRVVQEVLTVSKRNMTDPFWESQLIEASLAIVAAAVPVIADQGIEVTAAEEGRMYVAVRDALEELASEPALQRDDHVSAVLTDALLEGMRDDLAEDVVDALRLAVAVPPAPSLELVLAGPQPFARVMGRNAVLGMIDGMAELDPEPIHRFLAVERAAFGASTEDAVQGLRVSIWLVVGSVLLGLVAIGVTVRRDILLRRGNARTLRFLVGAIKARASDPAVRELLTAIADPDDPDAARQLRAFYSDHPDLRFDVPAEQPGHDVAPKESS